MKQTNNIYQWLLKIFYRGCTAIKLKDRKPIVITYLIFGVDVIRTHNPFPLPIPPSNSLGLTVNGEIRSLTPPPIIHGWYMWFVSCVHISFALFSGCFILTKPSIIYSNMDVLHYAGKGRILEW
jgi:hypothetical protein